MSAKNSITVPVGSAPPAPPRPPCKHDSRRLDGWLDTGCMRCGRQGYWRDGVEVDPAGFDTKAHPSGKILLIERAG